MTPDLIKLRELAGKAFDADVEVTMFQKGSKSQQDADVVRILALSEMRQKLTPTTIIALIDALEAANKRIAELETINNNMKGVIRHGRQIIAELEG